MKSVRGILFWTASTVLAFVATAGVFLMLAEIGTSQPGQSLSAGGGPTAQSEPLSVELQRSELTSLEEARDQTLGLTLSNGSDRKLTGVNVYLILYSEDTASQDTRYYEAKIQKLSPGESKKVRFNKKLDFSPPQSTSGEGKPQNRGSQKDDAFNILEIRAASSEGVSTVKTAVLSF